MLFKALVFLPIVMYLSSTCKVTECINCLFTVGRLLSSFHRDTVCLNGKAKPPLAI